MEQPANLPLRFPSSPLDLRPSILEWQPYTPPHLEKTTVFENTPLPSASYEYEPVFPNIKTSKRPKNRRRKVTSLLDRQDSISYTAFITITITITNVVTITITTTGKTTCQTTCTPWSPAPPLCWELWPCRSSLPGHFQHRPKKKESVVVRPTGEMQRMLDLVASGQAPKEEG